MTAAGAFRLVVLGQWALALAGLAIELWIVREVPAAAAGMSTEQSLVPITRIDWLWLLLLGLSIVSAVGLLTFRRWGPRLYIAMVAIQAVFMASPGHMSMSGWAQLFLWLDGIVAGVIIAWLLLAYDRLPFKR